MIPLQVSQRSRYSFLFPCFLILSDFCTVKGKERTILDEISEDRKTLCLPLRLCESLKISRRHRKVRTFLDLSLPALLSLNNCIGRYSHTYLLTSAEDPPRSMSSFFLSSFDLFLIVTSVTPAAFAISVCVLRELRCPSARFTK